MPERKKKFSWKSFGGDGFVAFHLLWEKQEPGSGDGVMRLFRMSPEPVPPGVLATVHHKVGSYRNGGVDMDLETGGTPWTAKNQRVLVR